MSGSFFGNRRSRSQGSRLSHQNLFQFGDDAADDTTEENRTSFDELVHGSQRVPSPAAGIMSSSGAQKQPPRSYFHHAYYYGSPGHADTAQYSSQGVREQTAELAVFALSEVGSSVGSPPRHETPPQSHGTTGYDFESSEATNLEEVLYEESEPPPPDNSRITSSRPNGASALTELLRNPPPDGEVEARRGRVPAVGGNRIAPSPVDERTALLPKDAAAEVEQTHHACIHDLESQNTLLSRSWAKALEVLVWPKDNAMTVAKRIVHPGSWDKRSIWRRGVVEPIGYIPSVALGLLLNILDALSYGMILFPLAQPIFAGLGPDGISMFYVSCIVSQLVYSCGGSAFEGGIGSEMIEVVPFFHKMASTILAKVGEDNPNSVIATTILSYSISSIVTGLVFFSMGACRLGTLIGFFPRHILMGCIGGVGWFLVATGLEVSARLDGNLKYDMSTLQRLFQSDTVFLWITPLLLAILLTVWEKWKNHTYLVPFYFSTIFGVFYFFVAVIPSLQLDKLRQTGWVFEIPAADAPFYHFYSLYDFKAVDWKALAATVPAMFALTFFGVLHVPINVPALGFSTGVDNLDVDRELIAHGVSNALSGFAGSIQNYLVYTNSLLFIQAGGDSRIAGVMLALGTAVILIFGQAIVGYIPILVVGALIFYLGIALLGEGLYYTWGKVHRLEYLTIVAIVVTMGAWDFVIGIFVGILLACVSFVVQSSQKPAVRASYSGVEARSLVRRHPIHQRYLREAGRQIHVTKLAGYMFFGTIVSVENRIRASLGEDAFRDRPIRYLIIDLWHVTGIDYSAAEAFTRVNRVCTIMNVKMIMCGVTQDGEIGKSLRGVGLWGGGNDVQFFEDLNSALEFCENELLKVFYSHRDKMAKRSTQQCLDMPIQDTLSFTYDISFSSPRGSLLHQAAADTLTGRYSVAPLKWQKFQQPLLLILQTFQELTVKNEAFWAKASPYFERKEYLGGSILFSRGDQSNGFYLLEEGILRAEYDLPQGKYYESIVAGTTCGELPFFSETNRTATVIAERDCVTWLMDDRSWRALQGRYPDVALEVLRISLKLTSERMSAITSYVMS
ncbi:hypothetical protein GP486_004954 [Trichoglossum hirsutum]|uniref:Sulfate transporter family protein n=1 Tax=Trichoglossum hirsutum TaxID=265104 RepID=A0A9P8L9Z0_9PEZI|nr:hypothetical protein GP486_004954 [Trichoglossum hirsutum]